MSAAFGLFHVKHRTYVRRPFHVKPLPRKLHLSYHKRVNLRRGATFALALLLLPLFSSCVSVLNPTGWAPVLFDGDTAYLTTSKGKLSAVTLSGDTATAKWTFPDKDRDEDDKFKTRAIYGAPILDGDRLYFASFEGGVFALGKGDGRPIWPGPDGNRSKIDGDITGGLVMAGGNLYFGTTEGRLYAWKASDGTPAAGWEKPKIFSGGIWATPVVVGETLFVATMEGELHALALPDGTERWDPFEASGGIPDLSMASDDLLFVPSINHHAYLVRTRDGFVAADFQADDWLWTAPAVDGSRLVFGDFGGTVYGLDITSAGLLQAWLPASVEGERVRSGPVIINDVVVVADRKPVVTFLSAKDGSILNRVPVLDAGTIRANLVEHEGAAYFGTTNGKLFRANPQLRSVKEIELVGVKK